MASLRKFPRSPFWFACITLPDGRRVQRSTKERLRKPAQAIADEWEKLSKERAKARQAQRVISDIYQIAHKKELPNATPRSFMEGWLARRSGEVAPASHKAYTGRAKHFLAWLAEFADRPIPEIETAHFVRYRDHLATSRTSSTANQGIKILRVIFEDCRRDGFISENPAKDCGLLKKSARSSRRPFTVEELRAILAAADEEWRSMILFGVYTGQRLGDLARLTWQNVDLQAGEITLATAKTGRIVRIPIAAPLLAHLESLPAGDDAKALLHPRAARHATVNGSTLSRQFGELLASVGLAKERGHDKDMAGNGRAARRATSELSFHSLRHTATSLMKNAGISPAIVQDIIGHESAEISAHYTHVEHSAKAQALAALPDFNSCPPDSK
jgi:integrase